MPRIYGSNKHHNLYNLTTKYEIVNTKQITREDWYEKSFNMNNEIKYFFSLIGWYQTLYENRYLDEVHKNHREKLSRKKISKYTLINLESMGLSKSSYQKIMTIGFELSKKSWNLCFPTRY